MKAVVVERSIAAPMEQVWAALTDLDAAPETLSGVARIERLAGDGYGPGVRWRETRTVFGKEATEEMTVDEADRPHRTVLSATAHGMTYRTEFTLTEMPATAGSPAGTTLTMRFSGSSTATGLAALIGKITAPLGAAVTKKIMRTDLDDIARAAERSAGAS